MKQIAIVVASVALLGLTSVLSVQAEVNVNVNVGVPVVQTPPPSPFVLTAAPVFIYPQDLGIYVAVDIPLDMFYVSGKYYLYQDQQWHRAPYYNGPWRRVKHHHDLPPGLRKHKLERIHYYRDEEYRHYHGDRDSYRGRHFKPKKEWKKAQKEEKHYEKERRKEERRDDKEERKMEKEHGKHGGRD
jgi:hypothetical protein